MLDKGSEYPLRVDPEPLHARDQRRALDIHASCRAVRARHSPVRHFQEADDLIALIRFARACRRRRMPPIVAQFSNRSLQCCPRREDYRTLDKVFQLTNISRPMPGGELLHGSGRYEFDPLLHAAAVLLREVSDQQRNIVRTFAQRWDADRKHVQAIVQVAAELAVLHHFLEIAIGRRHQPHIDSLGSVVAQPFKLTFLQSAEQFGLDLDGNISHLVQEKRAPICQLQPSNLLRNCSCEGASLMSKKFTFQQSCRNRSTVQLYESPIPAPASFMDSAR